MYAVQRNENRLRQFSCRRYLPIDRTILTRDARAFVVAAHTTRENSRYLHQWDFPKVLCACVCLCGVCVKIFLRKIAKYHIVPVRYLWTQTSKSNLSSKYGEHECVDNIQKSDSTSRWCVKAINFPYNTPYQHIESEKRWGDRQGDHKPSSIQYMEYMRTYIEIDEKERARFFLTNSLLWGASNRGVYISGSRKRLRGGAPDFSLQKKYTQTNYFGDEMRGLNLDINTSILFSLCCVYTRRVYVWVREFDILSGLLWRMWPGDEHMSCVYILVWRQCEWAPPAPSVSWGYTIHTLNIEKWTCFTFLCVDVASRVTWPHHNRQDRPISSSSRVQSVSHIFYDGALLYTHSHTYEQYVPRAHVLMYFMCGVYTLEFVRQFH